MVFKKAAPLNDYYDFYIYVIARIRSNRILYRANMQSTRLPRYARNDMVLLFIPIDLSRKIHERCHDNEQGDTAYHERKVFQLDNHVNKNIEDGQDE